MRAVGCDTVADAKDLAVVGISEIFSHLPKIYGRFRRLIAEADKRHPDLAIVIDSPAFNWRVARQMHKRGIPVVYYVCPQFWAWRQGRVRLLRKYVTKALVIFPFEEIYYRERQVAAEYVGHPLADLPMPQISREEFARQFDIDASKPWIALLPGSRRKEILLNLPVMLQAARAVGSEYEYVIPVASTLAREWMAQQTGSARVHLVDDARAALLHSRAAVVASGTATVEAALIGTPFLVVYRVSRLSYAIGRRLVKVKNYGMVNLIAGREIVPELIQEEASPESIARHAIALLNDVQVRHRVKCDLQEVAALLLVDGAARQLPGR